MDLDAARAMPGVLMAFAGDELAEAGYGSLKCRLPYHNRDGSLMLIEEYEQDLILRGEYFAKGEKFPVSEIDNGKGTATLFNSEGSLIQKIEYKNGKPCLDE